MDRESLAHAAAHHGQSVPHVGRRMPASVEALSQLQVDAIVSFVFADAMPLAGSLGLLDWYLCGTLTRAVRDGTFAASPGERLLVPTFGRIRPRAVFVFGLGVLLQCDGERLRAVGFDVARVCEDARATRVAGCWPHAGAAAADARSSHAHFCGETLQSSLARAAAPLSVPMWLMPPESPAVGGRLAANPAH